MCGFAGEYVLDRTAQVDTDALLRRAASLQHRGPDALGTWHDAHVGLSHARLVLLDAESGTQPMRSPSGTVLSYNGEIYNNVELRAELSAHGCRFDTRSDTEVLLAAYDTWGTRAWERLNGMFAFALYDPPRERLYLVRDRLGVKPVFYRFTSRALEFGSEPSAWEHLNNGCTPLNPHGVLHFLRFAQPVSASRSVVGDMKVLEPGTQLVVGNDHASVERWHHPVSDRMQYSDEPEHVVRARLRHLMHLAVGRQMMADAPVGVFLSGGIDSAIITGLLAQMRPEHPATFTVAVEGDEHDLEAARSVARRWRCRHQEYVVSADEFFVAMRELIALRKLPAAFPNEVLIYCLAKKAAVSVKAVLTGEGADELFGGYSSILSALHVYAQAKAACENGDSMLWDAVRSQIPAEAATDDLGFFTAVYSWFTPSELEPLLTRRWCSYLKSYEADGPFSEIWKLCDGESLEDRYHLLLEYAHLPNLLARLDGATMAASLEGRVPYTDSDLVRYVTGLPAAAKFALHGPDKPLLRNAFHDFLPPEVLNRPKRAFDASLERLFASPAGRRELGRRMDDGPMWEILDHSAVRAWMDGNGDPKRNLRIWLLLSLSMWMNRNML